MKNNPFANLLLPPAGRAGKPKLFLTTQQLRTLYLQPSNQTPGGLRDQAILHLLANGLALRQVFRLNLADVDEVHGILTVPGRNGKQQVVILETSDRSILSRWLVVRRLYANDTDALFISLHWTPGRSEPGTRLSERGLRLVVDGYLRTIGAQGCTTLSRPCARKRVSTKGKQQ